MQYDYEEIADIVGKSSTNCRQIFHRAKRGLSVNYVPDHLTAWIGRKPPILLVGCTEDTNYYGGIEKDDIPGISNLKSFEYIHEYRGHMENWSAVYIVYKTKDSEKSITKKLLKYIGGKPYPTGEISYDYEAGNDVGSGSINVNAEPENGIYDLGPSAGRPAPEQDSIVELLVKWKEQSEMIELEPVKEGNQG